MRTYLRYLADDLQTIGFPPAATSHANTGVQVFINDDIHVAIATETGHITIARLHPGASDIVWDLDYGKRHPVLTGRSTAAWEMRTDTDTPAPVLLAVVREAHTLRRLAA
ncbi:hypothetical protein ABT352_33210 [Streptosporangium sp. NPDC000563]|uniref:hypothetical protein n=1 Tax=Streptosporangium sp. NPDC000563 TaxID=3154366 RepID=UPI003333259C